MQPGIAFPRALQGETLDFSEPQPNRCWLLESHQKQAFMLLSVSLFLSLSNFLSRPHFHAFCFRSLSLVPCSFFFLSHSPDTFSHSLLCLTSSPPLCRGQRPQCRPGSALSGLKSLFSLCFVKLPVFRFLCVRCLSLFAFTSEPRSCIFLNTEKERKTLLLLMVLLSVFFFLCPL